MSNLAVKLEQYERITSSLRWLQILYENANDTYYASIERLRDNQMYRYMLKMDKIDSEGIKEATRGELGDVYQTVNPMYSFKKGRQASNAASVNWLWVDIDNPTGSQDFIYEILGKLDSLRLPSPTIRLYSGRGLWLMWRIDAISANSRHPLFKEWERIQDRLGESMEHLGADRGAKDVSRLCRMVGSVNSKSGQKVVADYAAGYTYTLEDFSRYFPKPEKKKPTKSSRTNQEAKKGLQEAPQSVPVKKEGKIRYFFNEFTMKRSRAQDVHRLIQIRGGDMEGYRDKALFIYGTSILKLINSPEDIGRALENINEEFAEPLPIKEVHRIAKGILEYKEEFRWKNQTVIEWLQITPEEQQELSFIISKDEKKRRDAKYQREKRKEVAERTGRTMANYQAKRLEEQMKKVADMKKAIQDDPTISNRSIATLLGISPTAVSKIRKKYEF